MDFQYSSAIDVPIPQPIIVLGIEPVLWQDEPVNEQRTVLKFPTLG
jgi:hypothetical protein